MEPLLRALLDVACCGILYCIISDWTHPDPMGAITAIRPKRSTMPALERMSWPIVIRRGQFSDERLPAPLSGASKRRPIKEAEAGGAEDDCGGVVRSAQSTAGNVSRVEQTKHEASGSRRS